MQKPKLITLSLVMLSSSFTTQANTLIAAHPRAKMDGENKVVAMYGNSYTHYNNNVNTRLRDLARSLLPNQAEGYNYRGMTISSGHLGWHLPNLQFQNTLQKWDVVILQGNSTETISHKKEIREDFINSAIKMVDIAHKSGSKVVYFMTWAPYKKPEQIQEIVDAYIDIARQTGGYVAPVGLAFEESIKKHPEINLYFVDGRHPSLEGTYLTACVIFATLYNQSPVGGAVATGSDMTPETAAALQQIVWDTVQRFQNQFAL